MRRSAATKEVGFKLGVSANVGKSLVEKFYRLVATYTIPG